MYLKACKELKMRDNFYLQVLHPLYGLPEWKDYRDPTANNQAEIDLKMNTCLSSHSLY